MEEAKEDTENTEPQRESIHFPASYIEPLSPYLPSSLNTPPVPFVTLTYATSLDASISLAPGTRTALSGPLSKAMTHYLRTRHDAILVGTGTVLADDPALNSRLEPPPGVPSLPLSNQPRPVILDPHGRWMWYSRQAEPKVIRLAREGLGLAPYIVVENKTFITRYFQSPEQRDLEAMGGRYISISVDENGRFRWKDLLSSLGREGLMSVMVEGGGEVINSLLAEDAQTERGFIDSVVVTIAPTWLGKGGVVASPLRLAPRGEVWQPPRLTDVKWIPMEEDVVLCGRMLRR